jgi:hypothetical protein
MNVTKFFNIYYSSVTYVFKSNHGNGFNQIIKTFFFFSTTLTIRLDNQNYTLN